MTIDDMEAMGWQYMNKLYKWERYRKIENGKGHWCILYDGEILPITYDQAMGFEPLNLPYEPIHNLSVRLGRMLLG